MDKRINIAYQNEETISKVKTSFSLAKPRSILLNDFLEEKLYSKILNEFSKSKDKKIYSPHLHSYSELEAPKELIELVKSQFFTSFIQKVTGKKMGPVKFSCQKFKHQDYTLISEKNKSKERTEFFFIFTSSEWQAQQGGYTAYSQGDGQPVIFPVIKNSLAVIQTENETYDFVKYIKHFAGKSTIIKVKGEIG